MNELVTPDMTLKNLCQKWQQAHTTQDPIQWYDLRMLLATAAGRCPITNKNQDWLILSKIARQHQYRAHYYKAYSKVCRVKK